MHCSSENVPYSSGKTTALGDPKQMHCPDPRSEVPCRRHRQQWHKVILALCLAWEARVVDRESQLAQLSLALNRAAGTWVAEDVISSFLRVRVHGSQGLHDWTRRCCPRARLTRPRSLSAGRAIDHCTHGCGGQLKRIDPVLIRSRALGRGARRGADTLR